MGIQERKEREKERRRQQIMVAAKRVFSDKGFNKATMEDIAQEAELSPGTAVLAGRWDAGGVAGRVASLEAGKVEIAYDWNGVTVTSRMDAVMALPAGEGSLALRWVGYRGEGDQDDPGRHGNAQCVAWLCHAELTNPSVGASLQQLRRRRHRPGAVFAGRSL